MDDVELADPDDEDIRVRARADAGGLVIVETMRIEWRGQEPTTVWEPNGALADPTPDEVELALADALGKRRSSRRKCRECGEKTLPERGARIDGRFTCHACMTIEHGVVF